MLPAKVYVEPTTRCNLACPMCLRASQDEPMGDMDETAYRSVVDLACEAGADLTVSFAGLGEPLLHPRIVEMIALAAEAGARTELTTNGTLLDRAMSNALVHSGLSRLWVSFDGDSDPCGSPGHAQSGHVRENLRAFVPLRDGSPVELGLAHVITRGNRSQLGDLLHFARELPADLVHLSHLIPYAAGQHLESLVPTWYARRETGPELPWIGAARVNADGSFTVLPPPERGRCPFVDAEAIAVAWDGRVAPCLPLLRFHETHQQGMPRTSNAHILGWVKNRALADIWREGEHQSFRQRVKDGTFAPCGWCGACSLSLDNQADCYGVPFPACGGCPWLQGTARCP